MTELQISPETARALLDLARRTVAAAVRGEALPDPLSDMPQAAQEAGAFVTIHRRGRLRGCIGNFEPAPLGRIVQEMALAAAFEDPRFPPVSEPELGELDFEISVLSPRFPIAPEEVRVGEHGLFVRRGMRRGVLLPQVPVEWGWDRETFLVEVCRKAGLPPDAWKQPDTRLEAFTARILHEKPQDAHAPGCGS